jgi:hypothetical protein
MSDDPASTNEVNLTGLQAAADFAVMCVCREPEPAQTQGVRFF